MLTYNTQEITCQSAHQVSGLTLWESTTPVYLMIYGCCSQWFMCHHSYICTCLDHKLWMTWVDFHMCPCTIKSCLPCIYPWHHARDKIYQALPLLSRESRGTRLELTIQSKLWKAYPNLFLVQVGDFACFTKLWSYMLFLSLSSYVLLVLHHSRMAHYSGFSHSPAGPQQCLPLPEGPQLLLPEGAYPQSHHTPSDRLDGEGPIHSVSAWESDSELVQVLEELSMLAYCSKNAHTLFQNILDWSNFCLSRNM